MALKKIGYRVAVGAFSFYRDPPDNIEKIILKKFRNLTLNLSGEGFDIVHSHQPRMNYYSLITPKPFVFHYHGISNRIQEVNLKSASFLCRNRISKTISVSYSALNRLKDIVGEISAEVIVNGVDTNYYHTNLPRPYTKGDPQLLFVGMLYPYKNVMKIIDAMPKVLRTVPEGTSSNNRSGG